MMRQRILIGFLAFGCLTAMTQTNDPSKKSPAEMMREMRLRMLTSPPTDLGLSPTPEFPRVCGVLMDWPMEKATVSVVSLCSGDASIYTTGTFGVIGGIGHETVRDAAKSFVRVAERHYDGATPTKDYPYAKPGRICFYFVGYDGVRAIETDLESVSSGKGKCSDLFAEGQHVITELRLTTQQQKGEKR
jgi:hypothetical protein